MTRHHIVDGKKVPFSQDEEAARDVVDAAWAAGVVDRNKANKYVLANEEYIRRGIVLLGINVLGSTPEQALTAASMKEIKRGGPKGDNLANLHDSLETLKAIISAVSDQAALDLIDVTDDSHW